MSHKKFQKQPEENNNRREEEEDSESEEEDVEDEQEEEASVEVLFSAVKSGNATAFKQIVENLSDPLPAQLIYDLLSECHDSELFKYIIEHFKFDVNWQNTDQHNYTLLFEVIEDPVRTSLLLNEYKANVNAKNVSSFTPLMAACQNNNYEVVKLLLEHRADASAVDFAGSSALLYLCNNSNPTPGSKSKVDYRIAELLLQVGANPNVADNDTKTTPLHYAAARGDEVFSKMLLKAGANPSATNNSASTPISYAKARNHTAVLQLLQTPKEQLD